MARSCNVTQEFRPDGGVHVRVQVSDADYNQALRGLHALAGATGAAMHGGPHPSAKRTRDARATEPLVFDASAAAAARWAALEESVAVARKPKPVPKRDERITLEVIYSDGVIRIDAQDIASNLDPDATAEQIERAIREHADTAVSDGPWPSYRLRGIEELAEAVRACLDAEEDE